VTQLPRFLDTPSLPYSTLRLYLRRHSTSNSPPKYTLPLFGSAILRKARVTSPSPIPSCQAQRRDVRETRPLPVCWVKV